MLLFTWSLGHIPDTFSAENEIIQTNRSDDIGTAVCPGSRPAREGAVPPEWGKQEAGQADGKAALGEMRLQEGEAGRARAEKVDRESV